MQELYEKKISDLPKNRCQSPLYGSIKRDHKKNIKGLQNIPGVRAYAEEIIANKSYQGLAKTRYVNDKQITDHYAIIPTGQGFGAMKSLKPLSVKVYEVITRRFLAIFYPPAVYQKVALTSAIEGEKFFSNFKVLADPGYLKVMDYSFFKKKLEEKPEEDADSGLCDTELLERISAMKKEHSFR